MTDEVEYWKQQLRQALRLGEAAIRYYQCGSAVIVDGTSVVVTSPRERDKHREEYAGAGPGDFWTFQDAATRSLASGLQIGKPCDILGDRRGCPNFEFNDGDETYSYSCAVCGVSGSGEHPE